MRYQSPLFLLALFFFVVRPIYAQDGERPNIVLIVADDLGYGELGCYGQRIIKTPNVDRLAREGIRFTQFYSGQCVCAPSRCSLLTGKHMGHAAIRDNANPPERKKPDEAADYFPGQTPLEDSEVTLAEHLRAQGYATAAIGKWGLGYEGSEGHPLRQGFDRFFGYLCQVHAHDHYPEFLWNDAERELLAGNQDRQQPKTYSQDRFTAEALDFIRAHPKQPFFLYLPVTIPHLSIQVPAESLAPYLDSIPEEDYRHTSYRKHPAPRAGYAAMVSHLDRDVGRIVALLDELRLSDSTLILFTSDNGPTYDRLGGSDSDFFSSSGPLRGRKGSLWEGGIRVTLVAKWPGRIAAGRTCEHVAAFWDVLPTLCEVAAAKPPLGRELGAERQAAIDGIGFLPSLIGDAQREHEYLYWEFPAYGGQQAIRRGKWKAIRRDLDRRPDAEFQLFDLEADIGEQRNVAAQHTEVIAEVKRIAQEARKPAPQFPFPALDSDEAAR